jgi:hypothetical protein
MRRSAAEPKFADGSLDVTYASAEAITVSELVPSAAAPGNVPRTVSAMIAEIAKKPKRRAERSRPERTGTRGQSRLRRNMKLGHYRRLGYAQGEGRGVLQIRHGLHMRPLIGSIAPLWAQPSNSLDSRPQSAPIRRGRMAHAVPKKSLQLHDFVHRSGSGSGRGKGKHDRSPAPLRGAMMTSLVSHRSRPQRPFGGEAAEVVHEDGRVCSSCSRSAGASIPAT